MHVSLIFFQFFRFSMALDDSLVQGGGASLKSQQLHGVAGFRHGERHPVAVFGQPQFSYHIAGRKCRKIFAGLRDLKWVLKTALRRSESFRRGASKLEQFLGIVRKYRLVMYRGWRSCRKPSQASLMKLRHWSPLLVHDIGNSEVQIVQQSIN